MENNQNYAAKIEEIKLENFQSLRDPVEIPIKPLTFLYGPNSAGKSAICDSLIFIDAVLKSSSDEIDGYIQRWQHIEEPGRYSKPLSVEVKFSNSNIFRDYIHNAGSLGALPLEFLSKDELIDFNNVGPGHVSLSIVAFFGYKPIRKFRLSIDGLPILEIESIYEGGEYLDAPRLKLFPKIFGKFLINLAERHGFDEPGFDGNNPLTFTTECLIRNGPFRIEMAVGVGEGHDFDRDLISIANHFINNVVGLDFAPKVIEADRGVIPDNSLSAICTYSGDVEEIYTSGVSELSGSLGFHPRTRYFFDGATKHLLRLTSEIIGSLILSRTKDEVDRRVRNAYKKRPDLISDSLIENINTEPKGKESLHSFVNRCLSDHLFIDQGYQISYEIFEILPSEADILTNQIPQIRDKIFGGKTYSYSFLTVCSLNDKLGRGVTFQDVGTGISCVLPVVVALNSWSSFVQQPELHLHPALQSAVGDIYIEATKSYERPFHLIETHSEYVLLRCLRRIRETTNGKKLENDLLAFTPEDISVLYFDPQEDGSTKVKRLRVSSQGEFLDRWPRGFFEERGRDLFDE
jgi:hypothetical protein